MPTASLHRLAYFYDSPPLPGGHGSIRAVSDFEGFSRELEC